MEKSLSPGLAFGGILTHSETQGIVLGGRFEGQLTGAPSSALKTTHALSVPLGPDGRRQGWLRVQLSGRRHVWRGYRLIRAAWSHPQRGDPTVTVRSPATVTGRRGRILLFGLRVKSSS